VLKVLKQSVAMQNIIIFLLLNIFFLHVVSSLANGTSAFLFSGFKSHILDNYILMLLTLFTVLMVSWVKKISAYLLIGIIVWTTNAAIQLYLIDYSKFVLLLIFFYLVTGGIFFLFWFLEMEEAHYHPLFSTSDIGNRNEFQLNCSLTIGDQIYSGFLSNWGESSCFFVLDAGMGKKVRGSGMLELKFQGNLYKNSIVVYTEYGDGVGLVFQDSPEEDESSDFYFWNELNMLLSDRGFNPLFRQSLGGVK